MADRVGSEDMRWAVMAVNIQRQVGGNLAEVLDIVANTVRERAYVQRQVRVLSAEGRLSIAILSALIIVAFVQREVRGLRGVLNAKPLVLLGLWSYGFYLIHHSISRLATYEWGRMPDNNAVIFTLIGMAAVVAGLSWALFTFVEEPAEKWWRRHTPKRWLPTKAGAPVIPPDPIEAEPAHQKTEPAAAPA